VLKITTCKILSNLLRVKTIAAAAAATATNTISTTITVNQSH